MATIAAPSRRAPWDVMGAGLHAGPYTTVAEALNATGLDFEAQVRGLRSVALDDQDPVGELDAPSLRTVVRPMPGGGHRVLAAVGTRFTPIHNRDAFAVNDVLTAEYGAKITGVVDFRSGGASLLITELPDPITLERPDGGTEVLDLNLLTKNAHDGSSALTFALTVLRPQCTNALTAAINGAERSWKISHTPNASERVGLAEQSIIAALNYRDAFQVAAQAMLDTAMLDAEYEKLVERLYPVRPGTEETKAGENRKALQQELKYLYHSSSTLEGVRGTLWGGYNAITEYLDWGRPVRGGDVARAEGALEGPYANAKAKVWSTFAVAAGV